MDYATVKLIHQGAVAVSIMGFFARGLGSLRGARWVRERAARTLPHIVDTVLLVSAIALAWMLRLSPLQAPWLLALRPGRPDAVRVGAFVAALATFGYIVSVALSKDPAGFLAWIR